MRFFFVWRAVIDGHRAVPAWPGSTAGRVVPCLHRAAAGHRATGPCHGRASCLAYGPRHGPRAVFLCRAAGEHGRFHRAVPALGPLR